MWIIGIIFLSVDFGWKVFFLLDLVVCGLFIMFVVDGDFELMLGIVFELVLIGVGSWSFNVVVMDLVGC